MLLIYSAISFYNGVQKISVLQTSVAKDAQLDFDTLVETGVILLVALNIIILMRNHISLHKKLKKQKEDYIAKQKERKRTVLAVRFPAWQICLHIIWAAYLIIGVVLLCVYIAGNNAIHPLGLVAISTTLATFILNLIADMENLFHFQPAAYEKRSDGK